MSTRFTVICDDCGTVGPHIRRGAKAFLLAADTPRFFLPEYDPDAAARDWCEFLLEHEWCSGVRLVREYREETT